MIFGLLISCWDAPCTKIGCLDVLTVEIRSWDFSFGDGVYTIQIVGDDDSLHDCTIHISGNTPGCEEGADCVSESTCNASYTADSWTFIGDSAPDIVSVNVFKDEVNDLSVETEAVHQKIAPNGPDCEPTCLVSEIISHHLMH